MHFFRSLSKKSVLFLFLILILHSFQLDAQRSGIDARNAPEFIQPLLIYEYCRTLTSPKYTGRLTGSVGYTEAARWIETQLRGWGLQPMDTAGHYLQGFPAAYSEIKNASMTIILPATVDSATRKFVLEPVKDFLPFFSADSGTQSGKAVFAGWGISAPELGYDDYAGLDVRGKFVMCFRKTPDPSDDRFTPFNESRRRMSIAKEHGAIGVIALNDEVLAHPYGDRIANFIPVMIAFKTADMILEEKGTRCDSLKAVLLRTKKPSSFETGTVIECTVSSHYHPDEKGYNVVGIIEGSDSTLKKECIVIGAHADHCGQFKNKIFSGADDNASGTAVVMEIARTFATLNVKPKRSIVVVLFGGEEIGLKGSEYFVSHIPQKFSKVAGMLNFDMVGEGDGTNCSFSSSDFKNILIEADGPVGTLQNTHLMKKDEALLSDYASFLKQGIPCLSFSSNGPHLSYHQTGDTLYRLNPDIMADVAILGFRAAYILANRE